MPAPLPNGLEERCRGFAPAKNQKAGEGLPGPQVLRKEPSCFGFIACEPSLLVFQIGCGQLRPPQEPKPLYAYLFSPPSIFRPEEGSVVAPQNPSRLPSLCSALAAVLTEPATLHMWFPPAGKCPASCPLTGE